MTISQQARISAPRANKHLSAHECRDELKGALAELESLTHVTDPPNAFMSAMIRYETWHRLLLHPSALDAQGQPLA